MPFPIKFGLSVAVALAALAGWFYMGYLGQVGPRWAVAFRPLHGRQPLDLPRGDAQPLRRPHPSPPDERGAVVNKVYLGDRTIDGIVVTVDGEPLPDRTDVKRYSGNGFEWSYEGPEPSQLAYAILVDHLGDTAQAERLQPQFMRSVVANFQNEWEMTTADIDRVLQGLR